MTYHQPTYLFRENLTEQGVQHVGKVISQLVTKLRLNGEMKR